MGYGTAMAHHALLPVLMLACAACHTMGTPKVIYLARHGQTEWNRVGRFQGDPDLDPVGYANRVSLWLQLRDRPLKAIYTSALQRTQRTAELLAKEKKLPIQPRAEINEIHPGVFEGLCYADVDPDEVDAYVEILVDKLEASRYPSVPLMRRIERLLAGR